MFVQTYLLYFSLFKNKTDGTKIILTKFNEVRFYDFRRYCTDKLVEKIPQNN